MKNIRNSTLLINLFFVTLYSQGSIEGKITDESGTPVSGANVYIQNTDIGSISDSEGNYNLTSVPLGEGVLIIDFIGYKKSENQIFLDSDEKLVVNIALIAEVLSGQEVIVVGYGTQQRREVTGSISSISNLALRDARTLGFEEALQGNVSGVDVQEHTGEPGAAPNIRIRGSGSISAGNEPLYVVDIKTKENSIIVGPQEHLNIKRLYLRNINFLSDKKIFDKEIFIKVRSTGRLLKAKSIIKTDSAVIEILQDEKGISPGQACVFYYKDNFGERVLGGGWIDKTVNKNLSTQLTEH